MIDLYLFDWDLALFKNTEDCLCVVEDLLELEAKTWVLGDLSLGAGLFLVDEGGQNWGDLDCGHVAEIAGEEKVGQQDFVVVGRNLAGNVTLQRHDPLLDQTCSFHDSVVGFLLLSQHDPGHSLQYRGWLFDFFIKFSFLLVGFELWFQIF